MQPFQPDELAGVGFVYLHAAFAHAPHQPLGQHGVQSGRNEERLDAHVDQAHGRGQGVVGVQGREHQVAGERGAQPDLGGLLVADLTHQHDIRVLTQGGAQHAGEGQFDLGVDLYLVDARQAVFHRVFHGDDLFLRAVELGEAGV